MPNNGKFSGNPKTEWLDETGTDRRMQLLEDFSYTDPNDKKWTAPKGRKIDGASIPAPLWSVVGSPYTGEYRRASVVHDIAVENATTSKQRKDADKMFYYACLAGGCSERQAQLLYAGVRIGAWTPNIGLWSPEAVRRPEIATEGIAQPPLTETSVQNTFREIAADIDRNGAERMSFDELQKLVDRHLKAKEAQFGRPIAAELAAPTARSRPRRRPRSGS